MERVKSGSDRRAQTLFRLWGSDRKMLLKKLIDENLNLQQLMECLCLAYIRDDPHIMKLITDAFSGKKPDKTRYFGGLEQDDAVSILHEIALLSPLQDKEIIHPYDLLPKD